MTRGIFGDDGRFRATYWERFPGLYFAGDGARIDADGDFWLLGRVDDVMNVSGHRISTIEVESALVDHPKVAEAAVCGRSDATTGQAIVAYVTLKGGDEGSLEMLEELREHVSHKIGPIAKPANIVFTPELPKTRSGKIMRRLLRDVAEHRPLGDTTTLADPAVVERDRRPRRRDSHRGLSLLAAGRLRRPRQPAANAATVRSTSASLVRQPTTERRIAAPPSQTVRAHPSLALACTAARIAAVRSSSSNRNDHLVEHHVVQHLAAGERGDTRRRPRAHGRSSSLDEVGDPRAPELADRRPHGYRPCAARELGAVAHRVADDVLLGHVEVRRRVLHRRLVVVRVGAERDPAVVGHVQPLVRVGRPRVRASWPATRCASDGLAAAHRPNAPSTWTHAPAPCASFDDPREVVERRRCSPRPPARRRWSASRPRARRRARRRPFAPRIRRQGHLLRAADPEQAERSLRPSRDASRRPRPEAAAPRRAPARGGPSPPPVDAVTRRGEARDVGHLAAGHEGERRVGRQARAARAPICPATASSADAAGVGSARPVFWSQAETSQSAASEDGTAPPTTNPNYRPEPIAMRPGSAARASSSTTASGSAAVLGERPIEGPSISR